MLNIRCLFIDSLFLLGNDCLKISITRLTKNKINGEEIINTGRLNNKRINNDN